MIVLSNGTRFDDKRGASVREAVSAQGDLLEHSCRAGRCGNCKTRVTHGETGELRDLVGRMPHEHGCVLTCANAALSDARLDIAPNVIRGDLRMPPKSPIRFLAGQHLDIASAAASPEKVGLRYISVMSRGDHERTGPRGQVQGMLIHEIAHGQVPAQIGYASMAHNCMEAHRKRAEPWKAILVVNRGDEPMTGGPLHRVADYARDEEVFCFAYGDCFNDIDQYEESQRRNA